MISRKVSTTTSNTSRISKVDSTSGEFDASIGLPPQSTELGTPYFSAYLQTVVRTGSTPF